MTQSRPGTVIPGQALENRIRAYIEKRDLNGRPLQEFARGRIGYADLPGGQGYRVNGGGSDSLGLRLAARLTDRPYFACAKRARNHPAGPTRFTRPQLLYVQPAAKPRYAGPVTVLTGGTTFSAGETFAQALIDRPGRTVRIGVSRRI